MSNVQPLDGQRVVVTRAASQADELCAAFEAAGAVVERLPLLEVRPPDDPAALAEIASRVESFDRLVFTSANAVRAFLPWVTAPASGLPRVAAVGPATAAALRSFGVEPDVVAAKARGSGLVECLRPSLAAGGRILLPQADDARPDVARGLSALGADVTAVVAYGKRLPAASAALAGHLFADRPLGWVTFTSPRTVRHFVELLGGGWPARRPELQAISIGPVTTAELRRRGVETVAEAREPSSEAMVRATVRTALKAAKEENLRFP